MKIEYRIVAAATGTLDELLATPEAGIPDFPELQEVLGTLRNLAFIVEYSPLFAGNTTAQNTVADATRILAAFKGS